MANFVALWRHVSLSAGRSASIQIKKQNTGHLPGTNYAVLQASHWHREEKLRAKQNEEKRKEKKISKNKDAKRKKKKKDHDYYRQQQC